MLRRLVLLVAVLGCAVPSPSAQSRLRFIIAPPVSPPGAPTNFSPACGATNVSTSPTISFTSSGASSYALYFDASNPPTTLVAAANSYATSGLANSTTYYYLARGINSGGSTPSSACAFTTAAPSSFSDHPYRLLLTSAKLTELIARKNVPTAEYTAYKTWLDGGLSTITSPTALTTITSLTSSVGTAASGTFTVADATGFPTGAHQVRVGLEMIAIASRSGTTFTYNGRAQTAWGGTTSNIAHASGEGVYLHSGPESGGTAANNYFSGGAPFSALLNLMGVSGYSLKARWLLNGFLTFATTTENAHGINNIRWLWPYIALTYDWLYADLTASEKALYAEAMRAEMQYHLDNPYYAYEISEAGNRQRVLEAFMCGNHASGQLTAEIFMAAASYGDNASALTQWNTAYAALEAYLIPSLLTGPCSGGNGQEGSEYMTEVWTQTLNTLNAVKTAKGIDLYSSIGNYQQNLAKYILYHQKPGTSGASSRVLTYGDTGGAENFGDSQPNTYEPEAADHLIDQLRVSDLTTARYLKYFRDNTGMAQSNPYQIWSFLWYDPTLSALDYTTLPTIYLTPNEYSTGLFTARSAWTAAATWVNFLVGGAPFEHAHGHENSWQVLRNSVWLERELSGYMNVNAPGFGLGGLNYYYGPWWGTQIHNGSVSMTGHGSGIGSGLVEPTGVAHVPRQSTSAWTPGAYMRGDASDTYTLRAGAPLSWADIGFPNDKAQTFVRDFFYLKPDLVAFYDRLAYTGSSLSPTIWHAIFPADPTIAGQKITLTTGGQKIIHDVLAPTSATLTKASLTSLEVTCSGCTHLDGYRVNTTSGATTAAEESFQVIQVGDAGFSDASPSLLTSTNAYCTQVGTNVICAMRGASPTASVTFSYTGSPTFYILGLGLSTAYHFTASAGTATLAAATGSGDTTTTAFGVLVL